ncbi:MAG: right-handed parallel beta-helix repeat-containing protein [Acidimicrobiales bacterium]
MAVPLLGAHDLVLRHARLGRRGRKATWQRRLGRLAGAFAVTGGGLALAGVGLGAGAAGASASASCSPAGTTGLNAAVVATQGQTISDQTVAAGGCDVGIFVGPGVTGVEILHVTVTGGLDHGIFAEDTSGLVVQDSVVKGNGLHIDPRIGNPAGLELDGVSSSKIAGNTITGNNGGGFSLLDDGPFDPGAPAPGPKALVPSNNDAIAGNHLSANYGGCGIVLAVQNPGGSIAEDTVTGNVVTGTHTFGPAGPDVGGIVVAADSPGTGATHVSVSDNTVTGSFEGGVIVHAEAPHAHTIGVSVTGNTLSGNNWGLTNGPTALTGVIVSAGPVPPPNNAFNDGTVVSGNKISGQYYGIWSEGAMPPTVSANTITVLPGGTPVFVVPRPGSGYWRAGSDGGVLTAGSAGFYGSMGGKPLNKPVVGMAATEDQGGYWEVASDGGIFTFGDAGFHGSMGAKHLNASVVGMAATPYVPGPGGQASPAGQGYWEVAADGGIFTFGDAGFYGSMGAKHLNASVVGMAATPPTSRGGHGYWEVASDGGIFTFGDAGFYGSMGGKHLNASVVGMAATPDGHGYWEVASDGGVFTFGDAGFYGAATGLHVAGILATPDGHGYWELASDGAVIAFGDAHPLGPTGALSLKGAIVGGAPVGVTFSG